MVETALARDLWRTIEPFHMVWLAPEVRPAYEAAGVRGGWTRYFAGRAAVLGPVPPQIVTATFYGFSPSLVGKAIPDAWTMASPARVLQARLDGVGEAIQAHWPHVPAAEHALIEAAGLAEQAVDHCAAHAHGRPLFAAHLDHERPGEPAARLWWAATILREFRGDGHVACLMAEDIGPCESLVFHAATGEVPADYLQANRGWPDQDWEDAAARLRQRGWLDDDGRLTDAGSLARERLEERTDVLAAKPLVDMGADAAAELVGSVQAVLGRP